VYLLYDKTGEWIDRIIKVSNYFRPNRSTPDDIKRRYGRFIREIEVLEKLKEEDINNIVTIHFNHVIEIDGKEFPYYVMEKGDTDLKEYLISNPELDNQEKVRFCLDIFNAIKELHVKNIYHRDIKPDNIFLFREGDEEEMKYVWKIGDLGLMTERHKDYDDLGEKIGPYGWVSPESMNKFLTEKANLGFDCVIDDKSDIFQLGKLFWFLFQLNVPIGQITIEDFICNLEHKDRIFKLIQTMIQYSKRRRIELNPLGLQLKEIQNAFYL